MDNFSDSLREAAKGAVSQVQRRALQHCWEFEQDEEVSEVQVAYFDVPDGFRVAKFEPEIIAKILQKRRKKFKETDFCGRVWSRVKDNREDLHLSRHLPHRLLHHPDQLPARPSYALSQRPTGHHQPKLDKIECRLHTEASLKQTSSKTPLA